MKPSKDKFKIVAFPKVRHIFVELLRRGRLRNTIHAFVEIDVTKIRDYIRKIKKNTTVKNENFKIILLRLDITSLSFAISKMFLVGQI